MGVVLFIFYKKELPTVLPTERSKFRELELTNVRK